MHHVLMKRLEERASTGKLLGVNGAVEEARAGVQPK